jgi:hypothetical protein
MATDPTRADDDLLDHIQTAPRSPGWVERFEPLHEHAPDTKINPDTPKPCSSYSHPLERRRVLPDTGDRARVIGAAHSH